MLLDLASADGSVFSVVVGLDVEIEYSAQYEYVYFGWLAG